MENKEEAPGGEAEAEAGNHAEDHGKGKGLIGKKVIKQQADGEVVDYDEETHTYMVKFPEDSVEELKWSELEHILAPDISFKRFPQKKKELPSEDEAQEPEDPTSSEEGEDGETEHDSEAENHELDEEALTNSHRKQQRARDREKQAAIERSLAGNGLQLVVKRSKNQASETEPETDDQELENESGAEGEEEEEEGSSDGDSGEEEGEPGDGDGDGDSDSSLNESDLEEIIRKRKKKKRKHVLTLQRWRGYKKKRKLAAEARKAAMAAEGIVSDDQVVTDAMEEVAPRKKSRTRKLAEVDEIQRKRQKIAMELKKKLEARAAKSKKRKAAAAADDGDGEERGEREETPAPLAVVRHLDDEIKVSPYQDSKPSPFDRGIKLRGRKLRKIFKGKVSRGEIADYDRRTRYYKVRYDDGEVEKLMWKHVEPMLVPFEQLHTWDDPDSEVLATEKQQAKAKEKGAPTPTLKPLTVRRR